MFIYGAIQNGCDQGDGLVVALSVLLSWQSLFIKMQLCLLEHGHCLLSSTSSYFYILLIVYVTIVPSVAQVKCVFEHVCISRVMLIKGLFKDSRSCEILYLYGSL